MYTLLIEDADGRKTQVPFGHGFTTVGRDPQNQVRLDERNISRKHARITAQNGGVFIEDLDSYNGIRLNGDKINGLTPVFAGDRVQVGDYVLRISGDLLKPRPDETTQKTEVPSDEGNTQPNGISVTKIEPAFNLESTAIIRPQATAPKPFVPKPTTMSGPNPKLICVKGPLAGREWVVDKTDVVIGRDELNAVFIDHRSISRHHARLICENGKYRIVDLKSANGTMVNGEPYAQVELKRGDKLELGHVHLQLVFPGEPIPLIDQLQVLGFDNDEPTKIRGNQSKKSELRTILWICFGAFVFTGIIISLLVSNWPDNKEMQTPPLAVAKEAAPAEPPAAAPVPNLPHVSEFVENAARQAEQENWSSAISTIRQGLAIFPAHAELTRSLAKSELELSAKKAFDVGQEAFARGDDGAAKEALERIPESSLYYARAARKLTDLKNRVKVVRKEPPLRKPAKAEVSPANREQARKAFDSGNQAFLAGHIKEAIDYYLQSTHADPSYAAPHRGLGIAHAKAGNGNAAIEHYRLYLQLSPGAADGEQVRKIIRDYEDSDE